MKKLSRFVLILLFVLFSAAAVFYLELRQYGATAADPAAAEKIVAIPAGAGLNGVVRRLTAADVIRSPFKFKLLARLKGSDKHLRAGEYALSAALSPERILEIMVAGKVFLHRLTVPEGYTIEQIAALVAGAGLGDKSEFLKTAKTPALARSMQIDAQTVEGYLFPDTYHFPRGIGPARIIAVMIARFRSIFVPAWKARCRELGFSVHEMITLASIIERETGVADERPLISSVFHNRLRRGMRLESDPTVIYGISAFDGNLTRDHLRTRTAYNTYRISGLPPGPIANPGAEAIAAALYPADTSYLYFVARNDRTHQFSENITDHNRAVRKYQLGR